MRFYHSSFNSLSFNSVGREFFLSYFFRQFAILFYVLPNNTKNKLPQTFYTGDYFNIFSKKGGSQRGTYENQYVHWDKNQ